jgi:hypothetical protein
LQKEHIRQEEYRIIELQKSIDVQRDMANNEKECVDQKAAKIDEKVY